MAREGATVKTSNGADVSERRDAAPGSSRVRENTSNGAAKSSTSTPSKIRMQTLSRSTGGLSSGSGSGARDATRLMRYDAPHARSPRDHRVRQLCRLRCHLGHCRAVRETDGGAALGLGPVVDESRWRCPLLGRALPAADPGVASVDARATGSLARRGHRAHWPRDHSVGALRARTQLEWGRHVQAGSRADREWPVSLRAPPHLYRHSADGAGHGGAERAGLVLRVLRDPAGGTLVQASRRRTADDGALSRSLSALSPARPCPDPIRAVARADRSREAAPSKAGAF